MTIEEVKQVRDEDIDFSDIPEADAAFWKQAELRTDIDKGLSDIEAGRVHDFDIQRIEERGRARLAALGIPVRSDD